MDEGDKKFAVIVVLIVAVLGVSLWFLAIWTSVPGGICGDESVIVRSQYSASDGGSNQPVQGVSVDIDYVKPKPGNIIPGEKITNKNGLATFNCMSAGTTYVVTVEYKGVSKSATLDYHGESFLFVSVNPYKPKIYDIEFVQPQPV